jgi:hypothetical protein
MSHPCGKPISVKSATNNLKKTGIVTGKKISNKRKKK